MLFALVVAPGVAGCSSDGDGAAATARRVELERSWKLYQLGDPAWPAARERWLEGSRADRELLALNLVGDMIRLAPQSARRGERLEPAWRRAQRELLELPRDLAVAVLVEGLRAGRDAAAVEAIADTLGRLGAVDEVAAVLESTEATVLVRGAAVKALVAMGGSRALDRVGRELTAGPRWETRAAAAAALGRVRESDRPQAETLLRRALHDDDPFVRRQAEQSLAELGAPRGPATGGLGRVRDPISGGA